MLFNEIIFPKVKGRFNIYSADFVLPLTLAGIKNHPTQKGILVVGFNYTISQDCLIYKIGSRKSCDYGVVGKDVEVVVTLELLKKISPMPFTRYIKGTLSSLLFF